MGKKTNQRIFEIRWNTGCDEDGELVRLKKRALLPLRLMVEQELTNSNALKNQDLIRTGNLNPEIENNTYKKNCQDYLGVMTVKIIFLGFGKEDGL